MPRFRTANVYVFFKSRVSKRRAVALLADHNLAPVSWLPQLNGIGVRVPPQLVPAFLREMDAHRDVVGHLVANPQAILGRLRRKYHR